MAGKPDMGSAARRSERRRRATSAGRLVITSGTVLGVVGGTLVGVATPASAATLEVTNTDPSGAGSLHQALAVAVDGDVITFNLPSGSVITLGGTDLDVLAEVDIQGPGSNELTIDAAGASRVFYLFPGAPGAITISGLTVTHGNAGPEAPGGGIYARSTDLTLNDVDLVDNEAGGDGGGLALKGGSLSMTGGSAIRNEAVADGGGVDVASYLGEPVDDVSGVTVVGSTISGNTSGGVGGGIGITGVNGPVTITGSPFDDNHATSGGGLGVVDVNSDVTVTNVSITGGTPEEEVAAPNANIGGGAYFGFIQGSVTVADSEIIGNRVTTGGASPLIGMGGGLAFAVVGSSQDPTPGVEVLNTTIAENSASNGGGGVVIRDFASPDITNARIDRSTISGNSTASDGGGVLVSRSKYFTLISSTVSGNAANNGGGLEIGDKYGEPREAELLHSTIVGNEAAYGGGVRQRSVANFTLGTAAEVPGETNESDVRAEYTIVADNTAEAASDVGGAVEFFRSLVGDTDDGTVIDEGNNRFGFDPELGGLGNNGGTTATHAPMLGSPVIDAGGLPESAPETDQRGFDRVVGPAIDIGAVEGVVSGAVDAVVSVTATTATAVEGGAPGAFTFTRTGPTAEALTIGYSVSGTASAEDFTPMGIVTFPAGQASVVKSVVAAADAVDEPDETVIVTLAPGAGYTPAVPVSATVTIVEEAPPPVTDEPPCANAPEDQFTDVPATNVHQADIDCLKFLGITVGGPQGLPEDAYGPDLDVTRGQMATFLARLITEAGIILPADPPDAFSDDDGSPHEADINALAAAGIIEGFGDGTFGEGDPVRRDQMASFMLRAHDYISEVVLAAGDNAFTDDEPGNVHEAAINALEEAGVIQGTATPGLYDPSGLVRRDQMASFLIRLATLLATEGNFPVEEPVPAP